MKRKLSTAKVKPSINITTIILNYKHEQHTCKSTSLILLTPTLIILKISKCMFSIQEHKPAFFLSRSSINRYLLKSSALFIINYDTCLACVVKNPFILFDSKLADQVHHFSSTVGKTVCTLMFPIIDSHSHIWSIFRKRRLRLLSCDRNKNAVSRPLILPCISEE